MYSKIMVPLDGSTFAEAALPLALTLSRKTGAALHLVTVLEPIPSFAYDEWEGAAREWSLDYLDKVKERVEDLAGGEVTTVLERGHVVELLEQQAEEQKVDLVVMATHGRGMISRMWLGSVADSFVHHTDSPVILVRPEDETQSPDFGQTVEYKTVLVPLDGSELAAKALNHAVDFGELFGSAYHLTRVVNYPLEIASPYLPHTVSVNQDIVEQAKDGAAEYLEGRAELLRRRGMRVTTSVLVDAQAGHGILHEADEVASDLIAMATHGREGISRAILGSVADKVLRGTTRPLLLYRPPRES